MRVTLERPWLKNWFVTVSELKGDEQFQSHNSGYSACPDSQRWEVNGVVRCCADSASLYVFNQTAWSGTTGWEFWTGTEEQILEVALKVAQELGVELELGEIW